MSLPVITEEPIFPNPDSPPHLNPPPQVAYIISANSSVTRTNITSGSDVQVVNSQQDLANSAAEQMRSESEQCNNSNNNNQVGNDYNSVLLRKERRRRERRQLRREIRRQQQFLRQFASRQHPQLLYSSEGVSPATPTFSADLFSEFSHTMLPPPPYTTLNNRNSSGGRQSATPNAQPPSATPSNAAGGAGRSANARRNWRHSVLPLSASGIRR